MDIISIQVKSIKIHEETHNMLKRWQQDLKQEMGEEPCFDKVIRYLAGKKNVELSQKKIDNGPPWQGF